MRIVYLTAGAAGMYCGSCLHDNALVKALRRKGQDAILQPIYTPILTDQEDVSAPRLFLGGINIYLQQVVPLFRRLPAWADGFLNSPRLVGWIASRASNRQARALGALTVSMLRGPRGNQRKEIERLCRYLRELAPDVVVFSNLLIAGSAELLREYLQVPLCVVLQGDDIFFEGLEQPWKDQAMQELQRLAGHIDLFFSHTRDYGERMSRTLKFPLDRLAVTPLGIDAPDLLQLERAAGTRTAPAVGYLARIAPEKGLHVLVDAFLQLRRSLPDARLEIAGWLGQEHREYWETQRRRLEEAGLGDAFRFHGSVDRAGKRDLLSRIDVLSVPTVYQEPKGMFVLEGLAAAVPYVEPAHGAFPELHQRLGGGYLVPPEDVDELATRLLAMLSDRENTAALGQAGREAVRQRGTIDVEAQAFLDHLTGLLESRQ